MGKKRRLLYEYHFPGFRPQSNIQGKFGDSRARVIPLNRIQKKRSADVVVQHIGVTTTRKYSGYGICLAGTPGYFWMQRLGESSVRSVVP